MYRGLIENCHGLLTHKQDRATTTFRGISRNFEERKMGEGALTEVCIRNPLTEFDRTTWALVTCPTLENTKTFESWVLQTHIMDSH